MLVDYGGAIIPIIAHSPWNGLHLADSVMPFFLFIAGVSLALVYKVISLTLNLRKDICASGSLESKAFCLYTFSESTKQNRSHMEGSAKGNKTIFARCGYSR